MQVSMIQTSIIRVFFSIYLAMKTAKAGLLPHRHYQNFKLYCMTRLFSTFTVLSNKIEIFSLPKAIYLYISC
jgi:hypothetical protein